MEDVQLTALRLPLEKSRGQLDRIGSRDKAGIEVQPLKLLADSGHVAVRVIDVRTEIPRIRHQLIFETFASLSAHTAFVLVNDHDPKPLYYQLAAENAGEFSWDFLEEGPEVWRVRIGPLAKA